MKALATAAALTAAVFGYTSPAVSAEQPAMGAFLGAKQTEHPSWFQESFLDLGDDVKEAAAAGKRLIIYVYQNGCPYCHRLIETNFGQKDIVEETRRNFEVIAVNMWGDREVTTVDGTHTTEKAFARSLGVQYTPTLLFLDEQGKPVLRINGYYPPENFRIALDYVSQKKENELSFRDYFASREPAPTSGRLIDEPFFQQPPYLLARNQVPASRPLLVLFEQKQCANCEVLHKKVLADPTTRGLVKKFEVVQLDMWSDTPVVTPDNKRMTAREWAKALNVTYAPTMVYFDENGKEVMRSDAFLKTFHTQSVMDYVLHKAYETQPEFQRYIEHRADALREKGVDVNIWE
jgi:thioredoxin-related protein